MLFFVVFVKFKLHILGYSYGFLSLKLGFSVKFEGFESYANALLIVFLFGVRYWNRRSWVFTVFLSLESTGKRPCL
jgi:hypothetical protein